MTTHEPPATETLARLYSASTIPPICPCKRYKFGADSLHPEFKRFVYGYHGDPDRPAAVPAVIATGAIK